MSARTDGWFWIGRKVDMDWSSWILELRVSDVNGWGGDNLVCGVKLER